MKLQISLLFACAVAVTTFAPLALAAECTVAQLAAANVLGEDPAFQKACPDVFDEDSDDSSTSLDVSSLTALNESALAVLAPCQQGTCAAYLENKTKGVPDCDLSGVNARVVFKTIVDFCGKSKPVGAAGPTAGSLEKGSLSSDVLVTIVKDGSWSSASSSGASDIAESSITTNPATPATTPAPTTASSGSPGVAEKDKDTATKINTKSAADGAAFTGAAVVVASMLLSVLAL